MAEELTLTGKHARRIDLKARIAEKREESREFRIAYDKACRLTELARLEFRLAKE